MLIQGKWYSQGSAAQSSATLRCSDAGFTIETEDSLSFSGHLDELHVSDRLGNIERKLTLKDGSIFATPDNDAIDKLFKPHNNVNQFIHAFESRLTWAAIALVVTIAFSFAFFRWGIPWASTQIAYVLPHKTNEFIADHAFEFLDDYIFEQSKLDPQKIEHLQTHFKNTLVPLDTQSHSIKYRLHFRAWEIHDESIPNALALPSGDIIITDKLIEISEHQDEIDSVLLHEMGHIVHRHTLKMIVESTFVTTFIMMITGDNNGLVDMGLGLGSILINSNYSRRHESEADLYAFEHMLAANIDPKAFSDIMHKITTYMEEQEEPNERDEKKKDLLNYISSHPSTYERMEQARRYSKCFKKALLVCDPSDK